MDRFIQMALNTVMRRIVNLVVNKGFRKFFSRGKTATDQTGADRTQAKSAKNLANRARDTARLARKIG
jgi:hypothetical protein